MSEKIILHLRPTPRDRKNRNGDPNSPYRIYVGDHGLAITYDADKDRKFTEPDPAAPEEVPFGP